MKLVENKSKNLLNKYSTLSKIKNKLKKYYKPKAESVIGLKELLYKIVVIKDVLY